MRIHFIAIGGSVMHNLAIALKMKGYHVSGSDDEIFEPSLSKLNTHGLLPEAFGWSPDRITPDLDAVILGMHARKDNPELLRAQALGLPIYSFPAYLYQQSIDKQRIVVAGSHGKTSVTSMIIHVLNHCRKHTDYAVGSSPGVGMETVKLSHDAPMIILEGDEYPSSPIDQSPKFLHFFHHIAVITGIAWDHINVFPTFEEYRLQFKKLIENSRKAGFIIYCEEEPELNKVIKESYIPEDVTVVPYKAHPYLVKEGRTFLVTDKKEKVPIQVFGEHNMRNLSAAKIVLMRLGITEEAFYQAIASFKGAARRLELLRETAHTRIYRDFAHAPSKLVATVKAVKQQYPSQKLIACMELHTFSSLNKRFLPHYANTMDQADVAVVYYNPKTVEHKRLEPISAEEIKQGFRRQDLVVFTDSAEMEAWLKQQSWQNANLLLMSSGNFNNLDLNALAAAI